MTIKSIAEIDIIINVKNDNDPNINNNCFFNEYSDQFFMVM